MRKSISIIATAVITGFIAIAGAMSSFATEDVTVKDIHLTVTK